MIINEKLWLVRLIAAFCFIIAILIVGCGGGGDGDVSPPDDPTPVTGTGAIQGRVTSSDGSLLNSVHVRAVNLSDNNQLSAFSGIGSTGSNNKLSNLSGTNTKLII